MCWAAGILLLPLGDFHNLIYHPIKDFLLIFSLISPPFSQLYGFVPHGISVPIFFPSKHLQLILLLYLHQNTKFQFLGISGFSYGENQAPKPIISSWLPYFYRKVPSTEVPFRLPELCRQRASNSPVLRCVCFSVCTTRILILVSSCVPCSIWYLWSCVIS